MECVLLYWHLHRNYYENERVIGKKIENIDFATLKWKSARELEDKNGEYIVNE